MKNKTTKDAVPSGKGDREFSVLAATLVGTIATAGICCASQDQVGLILSEISHFTGEYFRTLEIFAATLFFNFLWLAQGIRELQNSTPAGSSWQETENVVLRTVLSVLIGIISLNKMIHNPFFFLPLIQIQVFANYTHLGTLLMALNSSVACVGVSFLACRFLVLISPSRVTHVQVCLALMTLLVVPTYAHAADLEGTLRNLVNSFTGRILPIIAVGYLGKNVFSHIQGDPNARNETIRVVIAITCLMGLSGVWNFINSQVR